MGRLEKNVDIVVFLVSFVSFLIGGTILFGLPTVMFIVGGLGIAAALWVVPNGDN